MRKDNVLLSTARFTLLALALLLSSCGGSRNSLAANSEIAASGVPLGKPQPAAVSPPVAVDTSRALAQLPKLAAPAGVDSAVWGKLTAELARVLRARADNGLARTASSPPQDKGSATALSYDPSSASLSWGYYCVGDYDQNGEVNIADLTPLALHYGEISPLGSGAAFPAYSLGAVVDGDGNGEINIGDITPIGINFGVRVQGYRVYSSEDSAAAPVLPTDANGPGTALVDSVPLDLSSAPTARRKLTVQVVPTDQQQYFWVRPYDGIEDGPASNAVSVLLPVNQPPVAAITPLGETVTLAHIVWSAQNSLDPEGKPLTYDWDFDGDGVYEYNSGNAATVDYYYYNPGTYNAGVRVTDSVGQTAVKTASVTVTQAETWHVNTFSSSQFGVRQVDGLLDAGGSPGLLYLTENSYKLVYVHATASHGESWGTEQVLIANNPGDAFNIPDSCGIDAQGHPAIAYVMYSRPQVTGNPFYFETFYLRAMDTLGTDWAPPKVVNDFESHSDGSSLGLPMLACRLIFPEGKPALFGSPDTNSTYSGIYSAVQANTADGSDWPAVTAAAPAAANESAARGMTTVAGHPAYLNAPSSTDLTFLNSPNGTMQAWTEQTLVDQHEQATGGKLLDLGGKPGVVYYDEVTNDLKFRRASNADGSAWDAPLVLDPRASDQATTAAVVDGRSAVVYLDRISGDIMFVAACDTAGTLWTRPLKTGLDFYLYTASEVGLASVAGHPTLAGYLNNGSSNQIQVYMYY